MKKSLLFILSLLLLLPTLSGSNQKVDAHGASQAIQAPVLKWQHGGCYSTTWCETGSRSSPAVADLDGDGSPEVIGAANTLVSLNGGDGSLRWRAPLSSVDSTWSSVVVADVDGNEDLEIVVTAVDGYVFVFDQAGNHIWSRQPGADIIRGLSAYDLDNDGSLEIIVTGATYDAHNINTWVYEHDGSLRTGWPQLNNDSGYAYAVWNDNAAVGNLDGDGMGEIVVPSDAHYICAYEPNGEQIPAHPMYGDIGWGKVGTWESLATELVNSGSCNVNDGREERHRANFAYGPGVITDVNSDGTLEVVVTGNMVDCAVPFPHSRYIGVYIFNADRSRFNMDGYDWQSVPWDTGAPLTEDDGVIKRNLPNPVVADLDGDGRQEILYPSYDGRVHAFWLDKTEHHHWPYWVYNPAEGFYRFASEPVVADLDNNGYAEVIFGSWVQRDTNLTGKLHILDYQGNVLHEIDLPYAASQPNWNGAMAAPTLANIDDDADLEVVLYTARSGMVAYDLPGTSNARILWGTGRGNYQRTGSFLQGTLYGSSKRVRPILPGSGDVLTYTITLNNPGSALPNVRVTDTLPAEVDYLGNLWASSGSYGEAGGVITWTGVVSTSSPIAIIFNARVREQITTPQVIRNTALIDDGLDNVLEKHATTIANGYPVYLPVILRNY